ncbi:GAF domain-containing protein [Streptomyces sp. NPDC127077]|uniref:GAF domain-containing protein n=1 Tax=Streptomyces sp. NPDC127077 TaxID=3347131 RepID=UPI0036637079
MSQEQAVPSRTGRRELNATLTVRRVMDGADVLCLSGILDTEGAAALGHELTAHLRAAGSNRRVILDLTGLRLLSAAGIHVLDAHTRHLSEHPVLVIVSTPHVREIFTVAPAPGLHVCPTLDAALAALPEIAPHRTVGTADGPEDQTDDDQADDDLGPRTKARTSAVIGMAQGIVLERYALPGLQAAFDLLRETSRRHDVPLRVLASAVVTAPRPAGRSSGWFPSRPPTPPPSPELLDVPEQGAYDRRQLLRTLVHQVVAVADADGAEVHLTDQALGNSLVLESHSGLDAAYRDHVAQVGAPPAVCARARLLGRPVLVADVTTDPDLVATEVGRAASAAGSRALYAVPALAEDGACVGVITVHHARPGPWLTHVQLTALRNLANDLARWNSWYRRTVVLDALEHLHAQS